MALLPFGAAPTANATSTAAGKIRLTGDLGGTAASPQVVATHLASPLPATQGGTGVANSKNLTVSNSLTLAGTDSTTMTFPTTSATIARTDAANTFTGIQTLSSAPVFSTSSLTSGGNTVTLPTSADTLVGRATTDTLTNKRITKRAGTTASSATPTINTDTVSFYSITALAATITSFTTNLSGTPNIADTLWIAITDNGTARPITWGASFEASGSLALPTTTVISTRLDVLFVWNDATTKWRVIGVA